MKQERHPDGGIRVKGGATASAGVPAGGSQSMSESSRTLAGPSGGADFGGQPAPQLTSGGASLEVSTTGRPHAGGKRLNSGRTIVDASTTKRPFGPPRR